MDSEEILGLIALAILIVLCLASCDREWSTREYPHDKVPWTEQPY